MDESILLTGATGLVGRATIDRLIRTRRVFATVRDIPKIPLPADAKTILHDLRDRQDPQIPESISTVVHLAQSSSYRDFPRHALDVFEVNVGAAQRLLDWAHRQGVARFIYASSGGVYRSGEGPFKEDGEAAEPAVLDHYAASKRCGEFIAAAYSNEMTIVILRFFFVYGPRQRDTMLMPRLIGRVMRGEAITLDGECGVRMNPVYVDDAADAVVAAVKLNSSETINVAGPEVASIRDIGTMIGEATFRVARFNKVCECEPRHMVGDTEKMSQLLVAPRIGIAEGLRRVVAARSDA